MPTCGRCSARLIEVFNPVNNSPVLIDRNPDPKLGALRVNFSKMTCAVVSLSDREQAIKACEDLYVNHDSSCVARERVNVSDPRIKD
jgi:hypothetical protein